MNIETVVSSLERFYGLIPAPPRDPFAFFVWHVVGDKATVERREAALAALRRIPALTPDAVFSAPKGRVQAAVTLAGGDCDQRIRTLDAGVGWFRRSRELANRLAGSLTTARRALREAPSFDESTRGQLLLFAGGHAVVPLDPALVRVGGRLGFGAPNGGSPRRQARGVRRAIQLALGHDRERVTRAVVYLSHHAARACVAGTPHCGVCPLREECPGRV